MKKKIISGAVVLLVVAVFLVWDIGHAVAQEKTDAITAASVPAPIKEFSKEDGWYRYEAEFAQYTAGPATVAIARADQSLVLEEAAIENLVREAVALAGGFAGKFKAGDMVLIKPNIVDPEAPGTGEVTDVRVVKAVVKLVNEVAPGQIEIVIGEGAPRPMASEMKYQRKFTSPQWKQLWDVAGYQTLLADMKKLGVNIRLSNLNGSPEDNPWQDLVLTRVPNGGEALPQEGAYYMHKDILAADFMITVPVMKIHEPGITVSLKNQIGIAPSTRYGFSKTDGVPQDKYETHLIHDSQPPRYWTDKEIVDLNLIAKPDFTVVDATACLEKDKNAKRSGTTITNLVRMNLILASTDLVATDHVCALLMGVNPDDVEHITLAAKRGLGTNDPAKITVLGAKVSDLARRFKKNQKPIAVFGQSNRTWIVSGPFIGTKKENLLAKEFIANEATTQPKAGVAGWSEPVYFTEDRINLAAFTTSTEPAVNYLYSKVEVPAATDADLWIGSEEGLRIYLNGKQVYEFKGRRLFEATAFTNDTARVRLEAGVNHLLVKLEHKSGDNQFSLNICETETGIDYRGNRVAGLRFTAQ